MRGRGTALLVGGLVLLAGIAAADALRKSDLGDTGGTPRATTSEPVETAATHARDPRSLLADAGVEGGLYATVAHDAACEFQGISLPELVTVHLFRAPACRFDLSPDEQRVALGAPCPAERTFVFDLSRDRAFEHEGCSPAWRADGRLTYVRRGDVVAADAPRCTGRTCLATLMSARQLALALDRRFDDDFARRFVLREIAWLTRERLVAAVAAHPAQQEFVFVFENGRLVRDPTVFARSFLRLHVLPRRRGFAVTSRSGIELVDREAGYGGMLPPAGARSVAYAPDETAYAAVRAGRVCFYHASGARIACVPLDAADLEWR